MKYWGRIIQKMNRHHVFILLTAVFITAASIYYWQGQKFDAPALMREVSESVDRAGIWAPFVYVVGYVLLCGNLVPSVVFKVFAGAAFGFWLGMLWVTAGSTVSAVIKFYLARYFFRDTIVKKIEHNPKLKIMDDLIERDGWKMLVLLRNVPVVNALFLNYVCGVTKISTMDFISATVVGNLPKTALFVYLGYVAGYAAGVHSLGAVEQVILWIGLAATVWVTWYALHFSKKMLAESGAQSISGVS